MFVITIPNLRTYGLPSTWKSRPVFKSCVERGSCVSVVKCHGAFVASWFVAKNHAILPSDEYATWCFFRSQRTRNHSIAALHTLPRGRRVTRYLSIAVIKNGATAGPFWFGLGGGLGLRLRSGLLSLGLGRSRIRGCRGLLPFVVGMPKCAVLALLANSFLPELANAYFTAIRTRGTR